MIERKIKSPDELLERLKENKVQKTVFTNGCFDILHVGHVLYLEKARKKGESLIVAVNTDKSVKKIKGPTRPVNPLEDRMKVIAALEFVDYVTWFDEDTPENLIHKLRPKVLVKGADWKGKEIAGGKAVESWGGEVSFIDFVEGKSTTSVIEKVRKNT